MPALQTKLRLLPYKRQRFVQQYISNGLDEHLAASACGYKQGAGARLLNDPRIWAAIDERMQDLGAPAMSPEECKKHITQIARNTEEKTEVRLKALDMVARMHGQYVDKLIVELSRSELEAEIQQQLQILNAVDADFVETKQLTA